MYINSNKLRALSPLLVTGIQIYFEKWDSHPSNDIKSNESNSPYPWICESHLFVLNSDANDIQKVLISFDPFLISYRPAYQDHGTQVHYLISTPV